MSGNLTESLLTELKTRATVQSQRSYKWLDVDARHILQLIAEVEECRVVQLRFERLPENIVQKPEA